MKIPIRIEPLVEAGLVDSVSRQRFERVEKAVDVRGVIAVVDDALKEEAARQLYRLEMGQR